MKIVTLPVSDLHPADYNPRKDLAPGDKQYEKLTRSIETFGYVEPIVWNRTTGNIVGGHQRLKVLVQKGYTEVQVVEVELNEQEERILNVSLNKISGRWDNEKLTAILDELKEQGEMALTGFDDWELDALKVTYDHIEDLLNEDFSDTGKSEPNSYTMTFTLPEEVHEAMDKYIDENPAGKVELGAAAREQGKGAYLMEIIKKRIADMERARSITLALSSCPAMTSTRSGSPGNLEQAHEPCRVRPPASHRAYERGRHRDGRICC